MQYTCDLSSVLVSGLCLDHWLSRYQSLVVGLIAVLLASIQVWIAFQNMAIQREQQRSRKMQDETQKALATLEIDKFLRDAWSLNDFIVSRGLADAKRLDDDRVAFSCLPMMLANIDLYPFVPVSEVVKNAAYAFPERASDLVELSYACAAVASLVSERKALGELNMLDLEFGKLTADEGAYLAKLNVAVSRLFNLVKTCDDLMPQNRTA